jgi:hypothetical protein
VRISAAGIAVAANADDFAVGVTHFPTDGEPGSQLPQPFGERDRLAELLDSHLADQIHQRVRIVHGRPSVDVDLLQERCSI